jgi:hypothetical protein
MNKGQNSGQHLVLETMEIMGLPIAFSVLVEL